MMNKPNTSTSGVCDDCRWYDAIYTYSFYSAKDNTRHSTIFTVVVQWKVQH